MRKAVLDTNVLIYIFNQKVDVITQLKNLGFKKFLIPDKVIEELNNLLTSLKGRDKRAVNFALTLIKNCQECEVVKSASTSTDDSLLEIAEKFNAILITNDKMLKKRAKERKIGIGYIREMRCIEIEDANYFKQ